MKLKKIVAAMLCALLLPVWTAVPAAAAQTTAMGVKTGLESYAIDLDRIYQGGQYEATLKIGENLSFKGTLSEGLTHERLWLCIDEALAAEHLTRQDVIETNKMVAKLLEKMEPKNFWQQVDFIADAIGVDHYTDTIKHMSASSGLDKELQNLTALEKQYVQEQLGRQMGESYDKWRAGLVPGKIKGKVQDAVFKPALGSTAGVVGKAVSIAQGLEKLARASIKEDKELSELKQQALTRQMAVEVFYKRAGNHVREYLDQYGQWQLRFDGSKISGSAVEQMTKLNFDANDMAGNFHTFYTIQPIKLTWTADILMVKEDHAENPNGVYTGHIKLMGEYDTSALKEHLIPLVQKTEQYSLAFNMSMFDESKMQAFERSKPSVKQEWRMDECSIELLGLKENGAASIQLPELVLEKSITMDYEISGSFDMEMYGYTYITTGYDELCTPERLTTKMPLDLPETYRGEVMDWVVLNPLRSTQQGGTGVYALNEVYPAERDERGDSFATAFIIRAPFEGFTGYKRIEIGKK